MALNRAREQWQIRHYSHEYCHQRKARGVTGAECGSTSGLCLDARAAAAGRRQLPGLCGKQMAPLTIPICRRPSRTACLRGRELARQPVGGAREPPFHGPPQEPRPAPDYTVLASLHGTGPGSCASPTSTTDGAMRSPSLPLVDARSRNSRSRSGHAQDGSLKGSILNRRGGPLFNRREWSSFQPALTTSKKPPVSTPRSSASNRSSASTAWLSWQWETSSSRSGETPDVVPQQVRGVFQLMTSVMA